MPPFVPDPYVPLAGQRWRLAIADDLPGEPAGTVYLESRTASEEIVESLPTSVRSSSGFGSAEAATGAGANGPDTLTFEAEYQAEHDSDDLRPYRDTVMKMRRFEPTLNRKPVLVFRNTVICDTYWLAGADITWEGGVFPHTGLPVRCRIRFSLTRAVEHAMSDQRMGEARSTFYHTLAAGETPEHLAARYLGSPEYGPKVRQTNPGVSEAEGSTFVVLPLENPKMAGPVRPVALPFSAEGWEAVFEARAEAAL